MPRELSIRTATLLRRNVVYLVTTLLLVGCLAAWESPYLMYLLTLIAIYTIASFGLDIMCSWTGMLVFCPAAFLVIGGYGSALLITKAGAPFLVGVLFGTIVTSLTAVVVSYGALVMKKPFHIVMLTFSFEMMVYYLLADWQWAGGALGIRNIPYPEIFGIQFESNASQYVLVLGALLLSGLVVLAFYRSRWGLLIRSTKEDLALTEALGNSSVNSRLLAFVVGAALMGLAGALYGSILHTLTPSSFTWSMTVILFMIIVLGGIGTVLGPLVGSFIVIGLPEALQTIGEWRLFIFGMLLVLVVIAFPRGIVGTVWRGRY